MSKKFYLNLSEDELNELKGENPSLLVAYVYLKRNSIFTEGKTKKILWGGLAAYHGGIDKTQAKRLVVKLEKLGLISATDTPQVFKLNLCVPKNDTITLDTSKTLDAKDKTSYINAHTREDDEDDFSNLAKQKKKITTTQATDKGAAASVKAATPPSILEGEGEGAETDEAAQIKGHAKAEGWKFWDNPKSLPYFQKAGEASKKLGQSLALLLAEFQSEATNPTAVGFKEFIDNYKRTHNQNQGQRRGDLVL
jgi:hypothetical protein